MCAKQMRPHRSDPISLPNYENASRVRVLDQDDAGRKSLGAQMSHAMRGGDVGEALLAASRDDRMRDEVVLID
ncbi:MAG: hypothetical protein JWM41_482 [Gemmatimonadetes bacterium]|nr:hypothetical protein [Gemmatimonadota bacterium]